MPGTQRDPGNSRAGSLPTGRVDQADLAAVADQDAMTGPEGNSGWVVQCRARGQPAVAAKAGRPGSGDRVDVARQHGLAVVNPGAAGDDLHPRVLRGGAREENVAPRIGGDGSDGPGNNGVGVACPHPLPVEQPGGGRDHLDPWLAAVGEGYQVSEMIDGQSA